eukprot:COSAG06_NODE_22524_length_720_cov_2.040258_1_plen_54_part_01
MICISNARAEKAIACAVRRGKALLKQPRSADDLTMMISSRDMQGKTEEAVNKLN